MNKGGVFILPRVLFIEAFGVFSEKKAAPLFIATKNVVSVQNHSQRRGSHAHNCIRETSGGQWQALWAKSLVDEFFFKQTISFGFFNVVSLANKFFLPCHLNFESE